MLIVNSCQLGYDQNILIKDLNLSLKSGITFAVGPNGAGKSTLLKSMAGILPTIGGYITFQEAPLHLKTPVEKRPAYLSAQNEIHPELRASEVFEIYQTKNSKWRSQELFAKFNLTSQILDRQFHRLSSGEQRKVLLVATLSHPSDFVILDEPLNFLDWRHSFTLLDIMNEQSQEGRGFLVSLHDLNWILKAKESYTLVLNNGEIICIDESSLALTNEKVQSAFNFKSQVIPNPLDQTKILVLSSKTKTAAKARS